MSNFVETLGSLESELDDNVCDINEVIKYIIRERKYNDLSLRARTANLAIYEVVDGEFFLTIGDAELFNHIVGKNKGVFSKAVYPEPGYHIPEEYINYYYERKAELLTVPLNEVQQKSEGNLDIKRRMYKNPDNSRSRRNLIQEKLIKHLFGTADVPNDDEYNNRYFDNLGTVVYLNFLTIERIKNEVQESNPLFNFVDIWYKLNRCKEFAEELIIDLERVTIDEMSYGEHWLKKID